MERGMVMKIKKIVMHPVTEYFPMDGLYRRMEEYSRKYSLKETEKALPFAEKRHEGQYRKQDLYTDESIPYFMHPLMMACHAASLGISDDVILAAVLLHDTAEDTGITVEELPFSEAVRAAVDCLTFVRFPDETRAEAKKRYYERIKENPQACLVKLLDRCSNLSTMAGSFREDRMLEYIDEAETYILPLADIVREKLPAYSPAVFALGYQITGLCETIKYMIRRGREDGQKKTE